MKSTVIFAVLLFALGIAAFVYQGVTYTSRDTVIDLGPIKATADREHTVPLPPIVGFAAIAGGIALLVVGRRERASSS